MTQTLEHAALREIEKYAGISPANLHRHFADSGRSDRDIREAVSSLWDEGQIRLTASRMWVVDNHYLSSVKVLEKRKAPISLLSLRAAVGMTEEEGRRVLRLLKKKKLVKFVRAEKCKTCGHVLSESGGWVLVR